MPMKWVEPEEAGKLTYEGEEHTLYFSYKAGDWNSRLAYWFTLDACERDGLDFDVRERIPGLVTESVVSIIEQLQTALDSKKLAIRQHEDEEDAFELVPY